MSERERQHVVHLDAAGAPVPSPYLLRAVCEEMMTTSFGNPHSAGSRVGDASVSRTEEARGLVLNHFGVTSDEYDVVFTSGTTQSINIVGQSFPWSSDSHVCYSMNAHTSLLGMRCYTENVHCFPTKSLLHNGLSPRKASTGKEQCRAGDESTLNLLLVPGECNFTGCKADLSYISEVSLLPGKPLLDQLSAIVVSGTGGECAGRWLWLLDAAKLAATSVVDLSVLPAEQRPHFVAFSFYKLFGYPTGLGALLVRRDIAPLLQKRYHGGGTLLAAAADSMFSRPRVEHPHQWLEDGTPHYYGIAALRHCFAQLESDGGMRSVQERCFQLTQYLLGRMKALRHRHSGAGDSDGDNHGTGGPLCVFYGRWHNSSQSVTSEQQGPIISFNLFWSNDAPIGFSEVGRRAAECGIQLRTGCFCNVGSCQEALGLSAADVEHNYTLGRVCSDAGHDIVNGRPTGAVRVSLGQHTSREDCDAFIAFLEENFLNRAPAVASLPASYSSAAVGNEGMASLIRSPLITVPPSAPSTAHSVDACISNLQGEVKLAAILVYPIKSCAGMRVSAWPLSPSGLLFDRAWALVDGGGKALTQKVYPRLVLVQPAINLRDRAMIVRAPGMAEDLVVPLGDTNDGIRGCGDTGAGAAAQLSGEGSVSVCGQVRRGRKISFDADRWFSTFLSDGGRRDVACSLMRCEQLGGGSAATTVVDGARRTDIAFANTAQFLLLSLESVAALTQMILSSEKASKGSLNITAENFRPNLLVSGGSGGPHQEDSWKKLQLTAVRSGQDSSDGEGHLTTEGKAEVEEVPVHLAVTGPCARCSMVNVDGTSGSMDCRAFQALATYRKEGSSVNFGQFCGLTAESDSVDLQQGRVWLRVGALAQPFHS